MLGVVLWTQSASILQHCFMPLQSHSDCQRTCIDPYIQFLSFCTPISMSWIISLQRAHSLRHHALEGASLVLSSQPFVTELALLLSIPSAMHQKVPDKPSTQREYYPSFDDAGDVGNHASSPPLQFASFLHDCQSQHLYAVFQPFCSTIFITV